MSKLLSANFIRLKKINSFGAVWFSCWQQVSIFTGDEIYGYEADSDNQSY